LLDMQRLFLASSVLYPYTFMFGASLSNTYFLELRRHGLARVSARTNTYKHKHTHIHTENRTVHLTTFLQIGINIFGSLRDVSSLRTNK